MAKPGVIVKLHNVNIHYRLLYNPKTNAKVNPQVLVCRYLNANLNNTGRTDQLSYLNPKTLSIDFRTSTKPIICTEPDLNLH